ncbi:MAG TPA: CsgG/HfaB family protein, partial [Candidatus Hypogeohydataceae bacterium YC40]
KSNYGTIKIKIESIESFSDNQLRLKDGSILQGGLADKKLKVKTNSTTLCIQSKDIVAINPAERPETQQDVKTFHASEAQTQKDDVASPKKSLQVPEDPPEVSNPTKGPPSTEKPERLEKAEAPINQSENPPPCPLKITLKNQVIVGTLRQETLPFKTSLSTINVPIKDVVSLCESKLKLKNGSTLLGSIQQEKLGIETKYGLVEVNPIDIVSIQAQTTQLAITLKEAPPSQPKKFLVVENPAGVRIKSGSFSKGSALPIFSEDSEKFIIKAGAEILAIQRNEAIMKNFKGITERQLKQSPSALRKTIAVADFENKSNYKGSVEKEKKSNGIQKQVPVGMADQLTEALVKSGRFIVLDRSMLKDVLKEQERALSGLATKVTDEQNQDLVGAAKAGELTRAQILVKGSITEFDPAEKGDAHAFSFSILSLGSAKQTAHVEVIIYLIDTTTGQVIDSKRAEGRQESEASAFSIGDEDAGWGKETYKQTPIGQAIQQAINDAVEYITSRLIQEPWHGRVVKVKNKGRRVFINSGSRSGIQMGMEFDVSTGEEMVDPESGVKLGMSLEPVCRIKVAKVDENFADCMVIDDAGYVPQINDVVVEVGESVVSEYRRPSKKEVKLEEEGSDIKTQKAAEELLKLKKQGKISAEEFNQRWNRLLGEQ